MKNLKFIILLLGFNTIAQINAPGDCIDAYRLCDANVSYNFQLVDWGVIDDAHGSLSFGVDLPQTAPNQCEWKSAWIKFIPKYSGTFGFRICPETVEKLNWMLCINPNCGNIETGSYRVVEQGDPLIYDQNFACTGIGFDPINPLSWDWPVNHINIQAGQNYLLFVTIRIFNQVGSHRFNLTFQGSAVTDHPDLFDNVACQLATTNSFVANNNVTVFPNPFSEAININSNIALEKTEIYDLLGKNVYSENFSNEIDTSFLQAGVYFIKLYSAENEVFVRKIVKR